MPVAVAIVGGVISAGGAIARGVANRKAGKMAEDQGKENAAILMRQAEQVGKVMGHAIGQFDTQAGKFLGSQEATAAKSGVEISGSLGQSKAYSVDQLTTDRQNLHANYTAKISELKNQARLSKKYGSMQKEVANIQAWGDFAAGAGAALSTVGNIGIDQQWGVSAPSTYGPNAGGNPSNE